MSVYENPFTPTFGEVPLYMAGRGRILSSMARAFEREGRAPELTTLVLGARGTGKTALLASIADEASAHGWICANVTAAPGMLEDILVRATREAESLAGQKGDSIALTGVGVGQLLNIQWENRSDTPSNWRSEMEDILDAIEPLGTGLLITVDEVQYDLEEMVQLSATYQQFVKERRRVALVMAGLPYNIEELKKNKVVSFLRRAEHQQLGRIGDLEVKDAFRKTIEQSGREIGDDALDYASKVIDGFPFMLQLVGYRAWDCSPKEKFVSIDDVIYGEQLAKEEMRVRILESTYNDLSDGDIAFLEAMLADDGDSKLTDIVQRLGKSSAYVNTYRRRLLSRGIIGVHGRGEIGFDLPVFKEFLREKLA